MTTAVDRVEPGEPMKLTAEVVDPAFVEVNDAQVVAQVTSPSGKTTEVPLEWTVSKDGEYRGSVRARRAGHLRGEDDGACATATELGTERRCTRARRPATAEYFDAAMRASLLNARRRGHRRPLLHAGDRRVAARGDQLQRPRRHGRRRARPVGHADHADRRCSA